MKSVNIHEAKTHLSSILKEIQKGETYIICKNGVPVAEIIPHKKPARTEYHSILSDIKIKYDPTEDLTEEEWGDIE